MCNSLVERVFDEVCLEFSGASLVFDGAYHVLPVLCLMEHIGFDGACVVCSVVCLVEHVRFHGACVVCCV